jgi:DNA-binding transcriptional LysR family regulator
MEATDSDGAQFSGFDAGIRVHDDVPRDMIAVRFGPDVRFVAVASPEYLASHEMPKAPRDLLQHRCISGQLVHVLAKWNPSLPGLCLY